MSQSEKQIGTLILPADYLHALNQVAGVTSENIVYLKRKFVSSAGWELVKYPLRDCFEIHYQKELPLARIIGGLLICALIIAIVVLLLVYGGDLEANTKIPLLALAAAGAWGVKAAFGGRRHRLKFKMSDGSTLSWKSRAGERELMKDNVESVVEFARSKGLLTS